MLNGDIFTEADLAAREILDALEPLRFGEAVTAAEREECFRMRYRAVLEFELAAAARFPDGLEHDDFDAQAIQILGRDGERAVATCRVVLPVSGRELPVATAFDLRLAQPHTVVEWGRVVVDPAYRGDGHSVLMGLAAQGWKSMRARGYSAAVGATPRRLISLLDALGFTIEQLGPPRTYWGEERYPILCSARPAAAGVRRRWQSSG